MSKFKTIPVVVEATQWFKHGYHPKVLQARLQHPEVPKPGVSLQQCGYIDGSDGGVLVSPGDWIISFDEDRIHVYEPDIFAATYEPVTE